MTKFPEAKIFKSPNHFFRRSIVKMITFLAYFVMKLHKLNGKLFGYKGLGTIHVLIMLSNRFSQQGSKRINKNVSQRCYCFFLFC